MNRKYWIITGIVVVALLVAGFIFIQNDTHDQPVDTEQTAPVSTLVYCSEEGTKPCIVSFGLDVDGNMLVNILMPDISYPNFFMKIRRGENELEYECRRVTSALTTAYCLGEKLPPGELLHLMLFSTKDEVLLAEGDLSIIGLEFPTVAVVLMTPVPPLTEFPVSPVAGLPTPTRRPVTPSLTSTRSSYPNPMSPTPTQSSYPNPSPYP